MRTFTYEVKEETGKVETGVRAGDSAEAVARELKAEGHIVVSVTPVAKPGTDLWESFSRRVIMPVFYPVSSKAIAQFFAQLKALLSAGMNVSEAMSSIAKRTRNRYLAAAAAEMAEEAIRGRPMSRVIHRYATAFKPMTLAVMEAGEESGQLELTADRLASYFDRTFQLEQMYKWHTFYPKVLLVALLLIPHAPVLVLQGFGPWLAAVAGWVIPVLLGIAVVWYGFRMLMQIPPIRRALDAVKLMLPWFGSLSRRLSAARWARALSMLLAAGVPIHKALCEAARASGNSAMAQGLTTEAEAVLHGKTVSEVLGASRQLPEMAIDMISTAERSGSYEDALDKIAEYYESETDVGGKQTAVAIGTIFYLIVAIIIGFIVIQFWQGYIGEFSAAME